MVDSTSVSASNPTDSLTELFDDLAAWAENETGPSETLRYGDDPSQFVELRRPAGYGPHPLVLVLHGGFWRAKYTLSTMAAASTALTAAGWASANVEYRRNGPGAYRDMLDDVLAARGCLDAEPGLGPIVALGHSAGGHLGLWLAAGGAVAGVVGLGAVCDLEDAAAGRLGSRAVQELLGGEVSDVPGAYGEADPGRKLPLGVPQVLVHGVLDDTVPIEHARRYAARAGSGCRLVELDGVGHFEVIDPRTSAWPAVHSAVASVLALAVH
jgi:acetyl esterase/lipase